MNEGVNLLVARVDQNIVATLPKCDDLPLVEAKEPTLSGQALSAMEYTLVLSGRVHIPGFDHIDRTGN